MDGAVPTPPARWGRRAAAWLVLVALAGAAVAAALAVRADRGGSDAAPVGGVAPAFDLPALEPGAPRVRLADFRGRPVVVNFFASWCAPCRREMPVLARVARELEGRVAFVGIDHQDSRRLARQLLAETGVTYPAGYDPGGTVAAAYRLLGMPTTVFVSPDGRILERHAGEISERQLRASLRRHFGP